jgi:hypothetical protein
MPSPKKKRATEPPWGITPPSKAIPSLSDEGVPPFVAVGSLRFEQLCLDIPRKEYKEAQRTSLKRKKGCQSCDPGCRIQGIKLKPMACPTRCRDVPVVAVASGVITYGETVSLVAMIGTAIMLAAAYRVTGEE